MTRLIYVYDTLCGWCFVARPEISKLHAALPPDFEFRTLHAHLFTHDHPFPINDATLAMVKEVGWKVGPEKTGARMSEAYVSLLQTPGLVHESGLSARAAAAADSLDPARAYDFEMALQGAVFEQGADFRDPQVVLTNWTAVGGAPDAMERALADPETEKRQLETARMAHALLARVGARGTPTLILEHQGRLSLLDAFDSDDALTRLRALGLA
ncbi:DsbA family protein [Pseudodonghicola flavimaris]|uniref:DsbA family protein n=1 Tax=Pseudodonghicola flavimaris TaxID=3050036 RepID=A0ABT7F5B1_9RHOB|nr:DsbA family protein [Pseudodonghicola flavimaris]MDK3019767.1 DsbA family protein [Pseudodonghicola flavimaris]